MAGTLIKKFMLFLFALFVAMMAVIFAPLVSPLFAKEKGFLNQKAKEQKDTFASEKSAILNATSAIPSEYVAQDEIQNKIQDDFKDEAIAVNIEFESSADSAYTDGIGESRTKKNF